MCAKKYTWHWSIEATDGKAWKKKHNEKQYVRSFHSEKKKQYLLQNPENCDITCKIRKKIIIWKSRMNFFIHLDWVKPWNFSNISNNV